MSEETVIGMDRPSAAPAPVRDLPKSSRLILTLGLISMLSGLCIVGVYELTKPRILANQQAALEQAVFSVLPEATQRRNYRLDENGLTPLPDTATAEANVFAGYDAEGRLAGLALEGSARGYQDVVRILYGYSLEKEAIIGMTVLQSTETPGLGDKVETDPAFLANFDALDARLNEDRTAMAHEIRTVKSGTKTEPWQVDAISGATVTSEAIGDALRTSTNALLPLLARHRDQLVTQLEPSDATPDPAVD
ncbi:MAG: FMN-binding protein [Opitutales bacterium]